MATTSQAIQKLLEGPAMAVPPGLQHTFVNPSNMETEFYVDLYICLILSILAVCIRMWNKVCVIRKVEIEDCKDSSLPLGHFRKSRADDYKTSVS